MRTLGACMGAMLAPMAFLTLRTAGHSLAASLTAALFICCGKRVHRMNIDKALFRVMRRFIRKRFDHKQSPDFTGCLSPVFHCADNARLGTLLSTEVRREYNVCDLVGAPMRKHCLILDDV